MPRFALLLLISALVHAAHPDYFPLQVGNQWTYRPSRIGTPFTVEIVQSTDAGAPLGYVLARGFPGGDVWLRMADDGTLFARSPDSGQEQVWAAFGAEAGQPYSTSIDTCSKSAVIRSKAARAEIPIGEFNNALAISYPPGFCADAGLSDEIYLPDIGLARRTVTTIAGPVVYDLVYARLNNGLTTVTAPEQSVTLALDNINYAPGSTASARISVRNTHSRPLTLTFPTGQRYDLVVRNDRGEVVYQWSRGRFFTQVFGTLELTGERTWNIQFPAPSEPGRYQVEAWLTTETGGPRASLTFEIRR